MSALTANGPQNDIGNHLGHLGPCSTRCPRGILRGPTMNLILLKLRYVATRVSVAKAFRTWETPTTGILKPKVLTLPGSLMYLCYKCQGL